jgi:hypothetical protein
VMGKLFFMENGMLISQGLCKFWFQKKKAFSVMRRDGPVHIKELVKDEGEVGGNK